MEAPKCSIINNYLQNGYINKLCKIYIPICKKKGILNIKKYKTLLIMTYYFITLFYFIIHITKERLLWNIYILWCHFWVGKPNSTSQYNVIMQHFMTKVFFFNSSSHFLWQWRCQFFHTFQPLTCSLPLKLMCFNNQILLFTSCKQQHQQRQSRSHSTKWRWLLLLTTRLTQDFYWINKATNATLWADLLVWWSQEHQSEKILLKAANISQVNFVYIA